MPLINVTAPKGAFNSTTQNEFMTEITNAVLIAEGASPEDSGANALAWAYFKEHPEGSIYVGKQHPDKVPLLIRITTPKGGLTLEARIQLADTISSIVNKYIGVYEGKLNHWLLMDEINEGGWAGNGHVFSIDDVKAAMNIT
ncbi:hypothetical protein [Litoribacillus peritrichatus]|uniref:4-oxalocrotonate tautomerase n=1 Tax=Litoribacillus peritrichatus TaxID=718191 RepID=A0ABP7MIE2_9GAMM